MAQKCWQWLRFVGNGQQDTWSHVLSLLRCPVTVDLPFCHWILLVRVFRHRKLLGSGLVSSYPAAPEALDLDLQTSNHRVHRRGTRLPPGQPNSRLSKIHWRILRDLTARTNPDPSPVRQLRFLAPGQGADAEEDHLSPDTCGRFSRRNAVSSRDRNQAAMLTTAHRHSRRDGVQPEQRILATHRAARSNRICRRSLP
jgi:hypothetical protein